ncbi:GNAT family N-acetyltransferase [Hyphomonas sp.]|uniref:GNAT family N-acetyltransferase n=1 Tax=Hyphomonas sp. TaxID=87 RepID=UPI0039196500
MWHESHMTLDGPGLAEAGVRLDFINERHRAVIAQSGATEAMWNWMPVMPEGTSFNAYFDFILAEARAGRMVPFTIFRESDGAFAGVISYMNIFRTHRRLRIGYRWHPEGMNTGLVPAAVSLAMIRRAHECRFQRLEFLVNVGNKGTIAAVESLGAQKEGVLRRFQRNASGLWGDVAIYSLVGTEIDLTVDALSDQVRALQSAQA